MSETNSTTATTTTATVSVPEASIDVEGLKIAVIAVEELAIWLEGVPRVTSGAEIDIILRMCRESIPPPGSAIKILTNNLERCNTIVEELKDFEDYELTAAYCIEYSWWVDLYAVDILQWAGYLYLSISQLRDRKKRLQNGEWTAEKERIFQAKHQVLSHLPQNFMRDPEIPHHGYSQPPRDVYTETDMVLIEYLDELRTTRRMLKRIKATLQTMTMDAAEYFDD